MEKLLKLNPEQENAKKVIRDYLNDPNDARRYITISGPGGSGKTFMLEDALAYSNHKKIVGATVSHFAKKVLGESMHHKIKVVTIAALLGKRVGYDKFTGEVIMVDSPDINIIHRYKILIIDEVSMIDDDLYEEILDEAELYKVKVIVVGDKYQLPPVSQDHDSKFFERIDAELTQVMRFKGPVKKLADVYVEEIRRYNDGYSIDTNIINRKFDNRVSEVCEDTGAGYIFLDDLKTIVRYAARDFKNNANDVNNCRIIAYKNATLDILNNGIRTLLYGKDKNEYEIGELIIAQGAYSNSGFSNVGGKVNKITNGDVFKVIGITDVFDDNGIACHVLQLDADITFPVLVVAREGKQMYDEYEASNKVEAKVTGKWGKYREFVDGFAHFKYSYAISVHKAQGASIKNVYVFEGEIMNVRPTTIKEKFQSLYVAVTRTRHRVYIFNKKFKVNNSLIDIEKNKYLDESTKNIPK